MSGPWFNQLRNGVSVSNAVQLPRIATPRLTHVLITVSDCSGSPSAARLKAQFEVLQPTSGGAITDASPGGMWTPLDADLHPGSLPDGDWPSTVADQTTTKVDIDKVVTASGSTAISIGSGAVSGHPFVVGQRISGSGLWMGASNVIEAIGSGGSDGQSGSSATLRFPGILGDSNGTGKLFTNPVQIKRTIKGFPTWRLVLIPTFTGGSSPAFTVSVSTITE